MYNESAGYCTTESEVKKVLTKARYVRLLNNAGSIKDVAEQSGVNLVTLSHWELGYDHVKMAPDKLQKIARVIGARADEIADNEGRAIPFRA